MPLLSALLLALSLSSNASAATPEFSNERLAELAHSKYWMRLLHYRQTLTGGFKSEVDGGYFFLSPKGKTDPLAELEADLEAFRDPGSRAGPIQHQAQCSFPERARFLAAELGAKFPEVRCKHFEQWRNGLDAESATLIFSTAFPNNPASMFGHTFLRLNGKKSGSKLTDYGVNFSAQVSEDENPVIYVINGVLGGYDGQIGILPYYMKVNEYGNIESRDLWEYDLNLTPEQIARMVNHLWELYASAKFDYYFFDENCSYQILTLLEVANPEWTLSDYYWIYVLPADTVKEVTDLPGAVRDVRFRPSIKKRMLAQVGELDAASREEFENLISGAREARDLRNDRALDAAIAWLNYRNKPAEKERLRSALIARAKLGPAAPEPEPRTENRLSNRPDIGHHSARVAIGVAQSSLTGPALSFGFRSAVHDLLNPNGGYEPYTQFEVLDGSFELRMRDRRVLLRKLRIIDSVSLQSFEWPGYGFSWTGGARVEQLDDFACDRGVWSCLAFRAGGAFGLSRSLLDQRLMPYLMAAAGIDAGPALVRSVRVGPGLAIGAVGEPVENYRFHLSARMLYDIYGAGATPLRLEMGVDQAFQLTRSFDLRLLARGLRRTDLPERHTAELSLLLNYNY